MSGSKIVLGMKKKEKSKDSLDESLDSLESGDQTDDSLEILDDSLGMSTYYWPHGGNRKIHYKPPVHMQ